MAKSSGRNGNGFKRIPMREIRAYALRIAEEFNPERIILFGSYAYGQPTEHSDVDLLVVMETRQREIDVMREIGFALSPAPFATDLIVKRPAKMRQRIAQGDWFLADIEKRGKVIYERTT